jgi:pentatricopeptide repeat protein
LNAFVCYIYLNDAEHKWLQYTISDFACLPLTVKKIKYIPESLNIYFIHFCLFMQLSEVMARRGMNPTVSDQAIRLDLAAKSRCIAAAEKYFLDLPETFKNHLTYGALLNCYCKELMTEKAEALMQK